MKRTLEVQRALEEAELIVGYSGYVTPLRAEFPEKPFMESGMTRELDRCRAALREAAGGRKVVLVSSGDAGVFGMAGPVLELARVSGRQGPDPPRGHGRALGRRTSGRAPFA